MIGCGKLNLRNPRWYVQGWNPQSLSLNTSSGDIFANGYLRHYSSTFETRDRVSLSVDLNPYHGYVEYSKNGIRMGINGMGFDPWSEDVFIMVNVYGEAKLS